MSEGIILHLEYVVLQVGLISSGSGISLYQFPIDVDFKDSRLESSANQVLGRAGGEFDFDEAVGIVDVVDDLVEADFAERFPEQGEGESV